VSIEVVCSLVETEGSIVGVERCLNVLGGLDVFKIE
jgi:hypothetical protein